ncbi:MAG: hypothetical protein Crog4KO_13490 [Crocinitomicaceae bacterium]
MKLLCIILLFSSSAFSQNHEVPFPDSNAIWVQYKTKFYAPGQGTDEFCPYIIYSYDQSEINGETYYNVYARPHVQGVDFLFDWQLIGASIDQKIGRFRIDSLKVYYQRIQHSSIWCTLGPAYTGYYFDSNNPNDEYLMYDFGLQVGDTFDLTTSYQIELLSIDSVLIEGDYYRRFNFDQLNSVLGGNYYWIEGIGSTFGFFPFFYSFEQGLSFDCFHEDPDSNFLQPIFSYAHGNAGCKFVGIQESEINTPKKIVRITDLSGRESENKPNTILIYFYSDGTIEKVFRTE